MANPEDLIEGILKNITQKQVPAIPNTKLVFREGSTEKLSEQCRKVAYGLLEQKELTAEQVTLLGLLLRTIY